jgi:FKBP-type peptidyl-prolyl cis-trans isomerase FklB
MKRVFLMSSMLLLTAAMYAQTKPAPKTAAKPKPATSASAVNALRTTNDSLSYAFGVSLGSYLKSQDINSLNYAMLTKAIDQTIKGQKPLLDQAGCNMVMQRTAEVKMQKISAAERQKGVQFLATNKKRTGVTETPSGLQYEVLTKGTGALPKLTDTVVAHYRGSLINGKEFDNSYTRGEPLTIPVAGVIPGWTEALQLMPVGSKWKLFIPSAIGYGDYGAGQEIPGGSTLVFEIELLGIGSPKPQQSQSTQPQQPQSTQPQ